MEVIYRTDTVDDENVKNKWQWDLVSKRSAMKEFVSLNKTLTCRVRHAACCVTKIHYVGYMKQC